MKNSIKGNQKVSVIGSGNMGSSIAEVLAYNGVNVILIDLDDSLLRKGIDRIRAIADQQVRFLNGRAKKEISRIESLGIELTEEQKEKISLAMKPPEDFSAEILMERIEHTTDYEAAAESGFVFEAVFEKKEVKMELFRKLSGILPESTVLASNTSSLSITELSSAYRYPHMAVIAHFFNPPYTLPLVEVVSGVRTSDQTLSRMMEFLGSLRNHRAPMVPVKVKESPGFVVNRILVPMMNEAISLLDEGVAARDDIDRAMKLGAGFPMGPLELADMVGLDVLLDVAEVYMDDFGDPKYRAPYMLRRMVSAGLLGKKTGEGFYRYSQ